MKGVAAAGAAFLLAGCAAYGGYGLQPGARLEDVERIMGPPAMIFRGVPLKPPHCWIRSENSRRAIPASLGSLTPACCR